MARTIEHRQEPADKTPVKAESVITKTFIVIAIVLSLVAAGVSLLLYQQLRHTRSELAQLDILSNGKVKGEITSLTGQMAQITAQQKAFQTQLMIEQENFHSSARQRRAETEAMSKKLEISNQQLLQSMEVLFKQKGRENIGWVLSEVEYLLLVANHSLQLQGDVKTAITALQLADDRLLNSGDPGTIDIRTQINEEIEQLKAVEQTDIVQLAGKLSGNIKMIKQLPVKYTPIVTEEKIEQIVESSTEHNAGNFEQASKDFLIELKKLVVLRQRNKPAQPMITPKEEFFLQQNLQLKLETARYALFLSKPVSGKQALYSNSLQEAINWLETYYDTSVSQVSLMLAGLRRLLAINIATPVPANISHSINLLRIYQKEIGQQPPSVTNDATLKDGVK